MLDVIYLLFLQGTKGQFKHLKGEKNEKGIDFAGWIDGFQCFCPCRAERGYDAMSDAPYRHEDGSALQYAPNVHHERRSPNVHETPNDRDDAVDDRYDENAAENDERGQTCGEKSNDNTDG